MIVEIDRYCRRTGMDRDYLSTRAFGDYRIRQWCRGSEPTEYSIAILRRFMVEHPEGVQRKACGRASPNWGQRA